jgi:hypothetical protein
LQADSDDEELLDENCEEYFSAEDEESADDEDDVEDDEADKDEEMDDDDDAESSESEWGGIESEEEVSNVETLTQLNTARNSRQESYIKEIKRSDLIIFVLDARAPLVARSLDVEQYIDKEGKKCIYVLNRAGMVLFFKFTNH